MQRSKPLRRKTPLRRTPFHPHRKRKHAASGARVIRDIPATVRVAVGDRAGGYCDWCGLPMGTFDAHHRQLRSRGGKHTLQNLVAPHRACHEYIHGHPSEATARGFMVSSWDCPPAVPVTLADGERYMPARRWIEVTP
jgi:hypothetical protein